MGILFRSYPSFTFIFCCLLNSPKGSVYGGKLHITDEEMNSKRTVNWLRVHTVKTWQHGGSDKFVAGTSSQF